MTIILFLIILTALVFVHELGHFLTAKFFGVRVDEFAIGFPPRLISRTRGETKYSINLIPFGGYVKIFGENPEEGIADGPDSHQSFAHASWWKQLVILLAGISMNIIFAWLLISISFNIGLLTSVDESYRDVATDVSVIVLSVVKNSPSDKAGLKEGDSITDIQSAGIDKQYPTISDIQSIVADSRSLITLDYKRGNATATAQVLATDGLVDGKKAIGISMGLAGTVKYGFFRSFWEGAKLTVSETKNITAGIYGFIMGAFQGQSGILNNISGPVGIAGMVGEASHLGISYLFGFIAMISINLAVLNCVPFPALDGGRALFVVIEAVIRRKIKPSILNWVNMLGFIILIALMIFITYTDIARLVH